MQNMARAITPSQRHENAAESAAIDAPMAIEAADVMLIFGSARRHRPAVKSGCMGFAL
jgi:hypothetical protein